MPAPIRLDHCFADEFPELSEPWMPSPVPAPGWRAINEPLADELGIDAEWLHSDHGRSVLSGNEVVDGSRPIAQAYAGHQFGAYSSRLGDGRALLIGEIVDRGDRRRELHLKGSGRTPFARGGDGKATIGPMLREFVVAEAMHALRVPTTRMLAVIATGEDVIREGPLPGAVLTRVSSSHVRVGTFQFAAATGNDDLVERLAAHVITRLHPEAADAEVPAIGLLDAVLAAQVETVARWMALGFVHGVMNTDNTTISGETIDYGPCAFIDEYRPGAVFSSIDHGGRYAFANQPSITLWNLARFAETLLGLIDDDQDRAIESATAVLETFPARFDHRWRALMRAKLGLLEHRSDGADDTDTTDRELIDPLLAAMHEDQADFTSTFRALAAHLRGDTARIDALFPHGALEPWIDAWRNRITADPSRAADAMDRVNPVYIPRNHLVEEALAAATVGDLGPFDRLVDVVRAPFVERDGLERYAEPAPAEFGRYRTFCGT